MVQKRGLAPSQDNENTRKKHCGEVPVPVFEPPPIDTNLLPHKKQDDRSAGPDSEIRNRA
jgi:hypothetical protein